MIQDNNTFYIKNKLILSDIILQDDLDFLNGSFLKQCMYQYTYLFAYHTTATIERIALINRFKIK